LRCADIESSRAQICHESGGHIGHSNDSWVNRSYVGDVQQLVENDFKGVKIDNCGLHNDMEKYAELMNTTGKAFLTERSDQGHGTPINDPVGNQTAGWCPYNLFRSSGDIRANWGSVHGNLQTVKQYTNVSRPGCCERRLHSRARASALSDVTRLCGQGRTRTCFSAETSRARWRLRSHALTSCACLSL